VQGIEIEKERSRLCGEVGPLDAELNFELGCGPGLGELNSIRVFPVSLCNRKHIHLSQEPN